ncbi:MAG: histidine kinase [Homoserinimonas sp.]
MDTSMTGEPLALPTPPGALRKFGARHPRLVDALLAAHVLPLVVDALLNGTSSWNVRLAQIAGVLIVGVATFLLRRARPLALLCVATVIVAIGFWMAQGNIDGLAGPIALYAAAVYRSHRAAWLGFVVVTLVSTGGALLAAGSQEWTDMIAVSVVTALIATLVGVNTSNRRRYTAALVLHADQLGRERDQQAQIAAAGERARIAREMHDIIAHSLTVIITLANGADAAVDRSPQKARSAIRSVRDVGRESLADVRRLLGVLREDVGPSAEADGYRRVPQPGNTDLPSLVEGFRVAGMPVALSMNGAGPSSAGLQLAVHRIVQECLTNVLRYAGSPTEVAVLVTSSATTVEITVTDNGHGVRVAPSQGSGHGLIGMRERVAVYQGSLEAGPRPQTGWRVHARLFAEAKDDR